MKIVFVYGYMFNVQTWSRACTILREDGIELHLFSQQQSAEKAIAFLEKENADIFVGQIFRDGLKIRNSMVTKVRGRIREGEQPVQMERHHPKG